MLSAFLFVIYLGFACFFITQVKLIKQSGLAVKTALVLFLLRMMMACILGFINYYILHNNSDYDSYNHFGYLEYQTVFSDPHKFFTDIFASNYSDRGDFFGSAGSYWNDLRTNIIFKLIGITDIFSRGNYFINAIFFNFVAFIANVALYRVFIHIFPTKRIAVIIGCFLLPSTLYFSSGIHKDLFVFAGLCFFCYYLYFSFEDKFTLKKTTGILLSFLLILFIRNFIAVLLLPCVAAWWFSRRDFISKTMKPAYTLGLFFLFCIGGIIALHYLMPAHDPLKVIADKQQAFLVIDPAATQYVHLDTLNSTVNSFAKATPAALRHSFLSPLPGEFDQLYSNLFSAELMLYLLLILLCLFFGTTESIFRNNFILFGFMLVLLVFLFTGYISTAAGALIRYRSIYFSFIIVPVLCTIDWKKIMGKSQHKIRT